MRRIDGSWRITHRHDSTPFYMGRLVPRGHRP
ncbi:MAG TPA: hypothetical protein VMU34_11075 [Mycobacterium sp.]|nr:hypothetical protein [Mycobacterium sp.]